MTDAIDIGEFSEAVNDKMDRDGRNADTTSCADVVIAYQEPTSENNYTWYRKYKSGWVDQGGITNIETYSGYKAVTLPIAYSDENFSVLCTCLKTNNTYCGVICCGYSIVSSSVIQVANRYYATSDGGTYYVRWEARGKST